MGLCRISPYLSPMANVLISLVGDQTVPNVFLIRDPAFRMIEHYIFVTTPLMEQRQRLDNIIASTCLSPGSCSRVFVEADNLYSIREQLDSLGLPAEGNHYYVNLTSGTKVMSIGLYEYFTQPAYRHCSSIFYIPIGKNAFLQVFPAEDYREQPLTYRITLQEYLASYGIALLHQKGAFQLHMPSEYTKKALPLFQAAVGSGRAFSDMMKELRDMYRQVRQRADFDLPVGRRLEAFLQNINYPLPSGGKLSKAAVEYLIGGWFEEWAYTHIREKLQLPDTAIQFGVKVSRPNAEGVAVDNECDVMFTHNNTLYIVECKAGVNSKPLFEGAAYKLATLRSEFGQRVNALLLTPSSLRDNKGRLRKPFLDRARMHRLYLFDREGLQEELAGFLEGLG